MKPERKILAVLRESEGRFRMLLGGMRDHAIGLLDATGRVATWQAGADCMEGYQADEIIGLHFSRFYPLESIALGQPALALAWAVTEGRFEEETLLVRKDHFPYWARVVITALRDERERVSGFSFVAQDITRHKLHCARQNPSQPSAESRVSSPVPNASSMATDRRRNPGT